VSVGDEVEAGWRGGRKEWEVLRRNKLRRRQVSRQSAQPILFVRPRLRGPPSSPPMLAPTFSCSGEAQQKPRNADETKSVPISQPMSRRASIKPNARQNSVMCGMQDSERFASAACRHDGCSLKTEKDPALTIDRKGWSSRRR